MTDVPLPDEQLALLDRSLAGLSTAQEQRDVEIFLSGTPKLRHRLEALRRVLPMLNDPAPDSVVSWNTLRARWQAHEHIRPEHRTAHRPRWRPVMWGTMLAGILVIVGVGRWMLFTAMTPRGVVQTYATAAQRTTLTLRDGTRVTLAPRTAIDIPKNFGVTTRTVALRGEAYFDVRTARGVPFMVQTGAVITRVLGTRFDVAQRRPGDSVHIAVVMGKVAVLTGRSPVTLIAGMVGHITDSATTITTGADMTAYTAWTRGRLVFVETPVSAVLAEVGRWYGYDFQIARPDSAALVTQAVTATFELSNRAETLTALQQLLRVTMRIDGSRVTLIARHPSARPAIRHQTLEGLSTSTEIGK